ncbi:MAG: hypothetical protein ACI81T_001366, partial [Bacteroidia bacterium]
MILAGKRTSQLGYLISFTKVPYSNYEQLFKIYFHPFRLSFKR